MTYRTTQQMFDKVSRIAAANQAALDADIERERRAAKAEARLDEPLTRREVLDALESVVGEFGTSDARNMLVRLQEVLK